MNVHQQSHSTTAPSPILCLVACTVNEEKHRKNKKWIEVRSGLTLTPTCEKPPFCAVSPLDFFRVGNFRARTFPCLSSRATRYGMSACRVCVHSCALMRCSCASCRRASLLTLRSFQLHASCGKVGNACFRPDAFSYFIGALRLHPAMCHSSTRLT